MDPYGYLKVEGGRWKVERQAFTLIIVPLIFFHLLLSTFHHFRTLFSYPCILSAIMLAIQGFSRNTKAVRRGGLNSTRRRTCPAYAIFVVKAPWWGTTSATLTTRPNGVTFRTFKPSGSRKAETLKRLPSAHAASAPETSRKQYRSGFGFRGSGFQVLGPGLLLRSAFCVLPSVFQ